MSVTGETREVLRSLLANLENVRAQRALPQRPGTPQKYLERQRGELYGLDVAIGSIRRRLQK